MQNVIQIVFVQQQRPIEITLVLRYNNNGFREVLHRVLLAAFQQRQEGLEALQRCTEQRRKGKRKTLTVCCRLTISRGLFIQSAEWWLRDVRDRMLCCCHGSSLRCVHLRHVNVFTGPTPLLGWRGGNAYGFPPRL